MSWKFLHIVGEEERLDGAPTVESLIPLRFARTAADANMDLETQALGVETRRGVHAPVTEYEIYDAETALVLTGSRLIVMIPQFANRRGQWAPARQAFGAKVKRGGKIMVGHIEFSWITGTRHAVERINENVGSLRIRAERPGEPELVIDLLHVMNVTGLSYELVRRVRVARGEPDSVGQRRPKQTQEFSFVN